MSSLNLWPARVAIGTITRKAKDEFGREIEVNEPVFASPEFWRALTDLFQRVGGANGLSTEELQLLILDAMNPTPDDVARASIANLEQSQPLDQSSEIQQLARRLDDIQALAATVDSLAADVARLRKTADDSAVLAADPLQYRVNWERPGKIGKLTPNTGSFTVLRSGNGAVGAPSFYLGADATTGLYRIGANNWGLTVSGAKKLDISATRVTVSTELFNTGPFSFYNGLLLSSGSTGLQFKGASSATNAEAFFENTDGAFILHASSSSGVAKTVDICASGGSSPQLQVTTAGAVVSGTLSVSGTFGANGAGPQPPYGLPGAATDPASTMNLANHIRIALLNNGIG